MLSVARRALTSHCANALRRTSPLAWTPSSRSRLLSTLAVLEQREGSLTTASLSAFTAAKKIDGTIHGFVAGSSVSGVASEAAKVEGVEKIIVVENEAYEKVRRNVVDF